MAGPYVKAALLCEQVIEGKDNVLSLIRVVDRVIHTAVGPEAPPDMPTFQHRLKLVIMLVAGDALGRGEVRVDMRQPSGLLQRGSSLTIQMEGSNKGNNIVLDSTFQFSQEGPHWFEVYFDDQTEPLTKTPLEVIYQRMQPPAAPSR